MKSSHFSSSSFPELAFEVIKTGPLAGVKVGQGSLFA
jgi:hypothetical protein